MEKFYWLKLKRDFFKRHDMKIIEAMPNGKDYIIFYLKLLCESIDHEGCLRFNEDTPRTIALPRPGSLPAGRRLLPDGAGTGRPRSDGWCR